MRRRLWIVVAAFMTQAGCESRPMGAEEFAPLSELQLKVAVSRNEVLPGDSLTIRVTAYNPTDRPIQWPEYQCMPLMYRVYTSDGERIAPPVDLMCGLTSPAPVDSETTDPIGPELAPGDSLVVHHAWSAIRNYHVAEPPVLLEPGAYTVVGGVEGEPELLVESSPHTVWVRNP